MKQETHDSVDPCSQFKKCYTCLNNTNDSKHPDPPEYCVWENNKCVKKNIDTDATCDMKTILNENSEPEIQYDNNCNIPDNTKSTQIKLMGNDTHKKYNETLNNIVSSAADNSPDKFKTDLSAKEICDLK